MDHRMTDEQMERLITSVRETSHTIDSLLETLTQWKTEGVPGNTIVVICKDVNGEKATPLAQKHGVTAGMYAPDTPWSGEHYLTEEYRKSLPDADEYRAAPDGSIYAAFLWPTN